MSRKSFSKCSLHFSFLPRLRIGVALGVLVFLALGTMPPWLAQASSPPMDIYNHNVEGVNGTAMHAASALCIAPDNGFGTVNLPPAPCKYVSIEGYMVIIDGLPPGTTIEISPILHMYTNVAVENPGGLLGGERQMFDAILTMNMVGTGSLAGYFRTIDMPVHVETHTGPRTPGDPVQVFPADVFMLQGSVMGDPDFTTLQIIAGTGNGLPSPGQTTLTQLPSGDFAVDSFFDITYQIDFVGAPGSMLDGYAGTTTGTVRMEAILSPGTDLAILKTVTPTVAHPGTPITYTIMFFNTGATVATNVVISDIIPITVTSTSVVSSGVAITDTGAIPSYVWRVQNLPPGASGTITVTGVISGALVESTFINFVSITCTESEGFVPNNSDMANVTVALYHIYLPLILREY